MKKIYKYVDPSVTRKELAETLSKGLGRALTQQEADTMYWLSECEYETRGVILDIFKESVTTLHIITLGERKPGRNSPLTMLLR